MLAATSFPCTSEQRRLVSRSSSRDEASVRFTLTSEVLAAIEKLPTLSRDLIKDHDFEERPLASVGDEHCQGRQRGIFVGIARLLSLKAAATK